MLTTAIARAYIRGVSLAQQLAVAQERVALRRELLQLAQTRFRTGLDTDDVVKQANIDLETANKREAGTRALLVLHQDLLAQLMGDGPDVTQNLFAGKNLVIPAKISLPPASSDRAARAPAGSRRGHAPGGGGGGANPCGQSAVFAVGRSDAATAGLEASVFTKNIGTLPGLLFRGSDLNYAVRRASIFPCSRAGVCAGNWRRRGRNMTRRWNSITRPCCMPSKRSPTV